FACTRFDRDFSHSRCVVVGLKSFPPCVRILPRLRGATRARRKDMMRISRLLGVAAAALMMVAVQAAPAKAQFAGGGDDMMTQMAPMLNMMKAKMGKKRFGTLMQTMGPMMSKMMDGSGGGFGGMNFGGY